VAEGRGTNGLDGSLTNHLERGRWTGSVLRKNPLLVKRQAISIGGSSWLPHLRGLAQPAVSPVCCVTSIPRCQARMASSQKYAGSDTSFVVEA
jgi:hypothetical protein